MDILFNQNTFDIVIQNGDMVSITSDSDLLMQRLYKRFKTFRRDLFWNVLYGVDYLNNVFGINKKKQVVDVIFRSEILKEQLVKEIVSFESSINNGNYSCKFSVTTNQRQGIITYYLLTTENGIIITDTNNNSITVRI